METHEMIQLRGAPFPKPLPQPASELIALFKAEGVHFQDEGGVLRFRGAYDPARLPKVNELLSANGLSIDVRRSIWTVYDDQDFRMAPLWLLLGIPEIWISEIDFALTCTVCGRKRIQVNPNVRVQSVATRKPIVNVNGQFTIVRSDVASQIDKDLSGAKLLPFDKQGRYYYLLSTRHLLHLIIRADQTIGFSGQCDKCGLPIFEMFFGPLRYSSEEWKMEDVMHCNFLSCNAYTPKAYDLLRKFEKKVVKDGIILLEA
jgi:hypothetical protein